MIKRSLRTVALAAAVMLPLAGAGAQSPDPVTAYKGKYRSDPRFRRVAADFETLRTAARRAVEYKLGLMPAGSEAIRIELRDALPADAPVVKRVDKPPFQTLRDTDGGVRLILYTEFLVNGRVDPGKALTHAMAQAAMQTWMRPDAYDGVPAWLREGLAVWAADELDDALLRVYRDVDAFPDATSAIRGLLEGEPAPERLAEYGLAVELLARQVGQQSVRELVQQLVRGAEAPRLVAQLLGASWDDFEEAARIFAVQQVQAHQPPERATYAEIVRRAKEGKDRGVSRAAAAFLREYGDSRLRGAVLYQQALMYRRQGRAGRAESALRELLCRHAADVDRADDALHELGHVLLKTGKHHAAARTFEELLNDHPDTPWQAEALYNLVRCWLALENAHLARRWLAVLDRSFPDSAWCKRLADVRTRLATTGG